MEFASSFRSAGLARTGLLALAIASATGAAIAGSMATTGYTSQPIGHYEFCRATPAECRVTPLDRGPAAMTPALMRLATSVNVAVNRAIKPMSDYDVHGREEVWSYPSQGVGDCEDYVLEKRRRLAGHGISLSNLLITVVRKRDGEGHAVLTLRSDKGDFILDNLNDAVKPWEATGYQFLKRQASTHTGRWVSLVEDRNPLVGSVRQQR